MAAYAMICAHSFLLKLLQGALTLLMFSCYENDGLHSTQRLKVYNRSAWWPALDVPLESPG